jgi:hypothetical protein
VVRPRASVIVRVAEPPSSAVVAVESPVYVVVVVHFLTPPMISVLDVALSAPSKTVSVCLGAAPYVTRVYVPFGVLPVSKMSACVS